MARVPAESPVLSAGWWGQVWHHEAMTAKPQVPVGNHAATSILCICELVMPNRDLSPPRDTLQPSHVKIKRPPPQKKGLLSKRCCSEPGSLSVKREKLHLGWARTLGALDQGGFAVIPFNMTSNTFLPRF